MRSAHKPMGRGTKRIPRGLNSAVDYPYDTVMPSPVLGKTFKKALNKCVAGLVTYSTHSVGLPAGAKLTLYAGLPSPAVDAAL